MRQNTVADDLLGSGTRCVLIGYDYEGAGLLPSGHPLAPLLGERASAILRIPSEDAESPSTSVFGAEVDWLQGKYNDLLLSIADDKLKALWVATGSASVYAPYDGGADLIYPTEWQRDAARSRYSFWLSEHPEGL